MKKRTRNTIIVAAAVVLLVVVGTFASRKHDDPATPVHTATVAYRPFAVKLPENGVVQRPTTIAVPSLVGGNIDEIYVRAGDRVHAGELLATIDNPTLTYDAAGSQADYNNSVANVSTARIDEQNQKVQYQAAVDTQRASLAEARRVYDADLALLQQKAIARTTVDADKTKLDQARVAYDQALQQLKLGAVSGYGQNSVQAAAAAAEKSRILNEQNQQQVAFTRITAPLGGIVQTVAAQTNDPLRTIERGDPIAAGAALFTIASGHGYVVKAQVDEQDIINVHVGQRALVTGQDFPGKTIQGRVAHIAPVATKSTDASSTAKQVLTTIVLDSSPSFLRDGMSADVDILTTYVPHALVVPNGAIVKTNGKSYVFVVRNGVAVKRPVVLGQAGNSVTIVKRGLAAGEVVVAAQPVVPLATKAKVSPMPSPSPSPSS